MVFGNIVSSPLSSLSSQQALKLANVYLESAYNADDDDVALVLCHDTEVSLNQAKKGIRHSENHYETKEIATAYGELGRLLDSRGHCSEAVASYRKAEKLEYVRYISIHWNIDMSGKELNCPFLHAHELDLMFKIQVDSHQLDTHQPLVPSTSSSHCHPYEVYTWTVINLRALNVHL
jgi:hypothetical protein